MSVLIVGMSYKTAPLSVLERVAFDSEGAQKLIRETSEIEHVTEATVLSTCNRTEVYADVDRFHGSVEAISRMLGDRTGQSAEDVLEHLYVHYDDGAVSHLFHVAAGLDSMVLGESQILGQTREALRVGQEVGTVGPALNVLFQQALRVGKRSHAETDIDRVGPSIVSTAMDRAAMHVGGIADKRVVVVGAGAMASLTVATAAREGARSIVVANRTPERAHRLAEQYGATAIPLSDLAEATGPVDVLVSCTGAAGFLIDADAVSSRRTDDAPLAVVDLALPRDVDPSVADLPGVRLIALETLAAELEEAPGGADVAGVRDDRGPGAGLLPHRPPQPERDPDRGRPAHDGDRRRRGRARPDHRATSRARRLLACGGGEVDPPGRREAAPPADRPRQAAGQRGGSHLLRRRARRAVRARPRGRRGSDEGRRVSTAVSTEPSRTIRVGTRASVLARTQSGMVADALAAATGLETELVLVRTEGDVSSEPLAQLGGTGVFVTALRAALLSGEVDVAVHSLKDLPTAPAEGIALAAVPQREDPRDVVVARDGLTLGELPAGSRVGTGAPRRVAQIAALGLGVELVGVRGNVDTRLGKVASGDLDAVVLARAGLARLGRADEATEVLDPLQVLPAPGQGALAVECRADSDLLAELTRTLDDPHTRACVEAERALLAELEAGCSAPVGALAEVAEGDLGDELWIRAVALTPDGAVSVRRSASGPLDDPVGLGQKLAAEMLAEGAADLISTNPQHQAPK